MKRSKLLKKKKQKSANMERFGFTNDLQIKLSISKTLKRKISQANKFLRHFDLAELARNYKFTTLKWRNFQLPMFFIPEHQFPQPFAREKLLGLILPLFIYLDKPIKLERKRSNKECLLNVLNIMSLFRIKPFHALWLIELFNS